ncbi:MAG: sensor domain-containing diguanylate cyclase [Sideroxydans sp.]|nr:sensor domain-containing diguanylate cyclase [Sideroxydans sp.]
MGGSLRNKIGLFIRSHRIALVGAAGVFILVAAMGELILHNRAEDRKEEFFRDSVAFNAKLRAQTESELNSLLYLSSGLGSYLVVRNNDLQSKEVTGILAVLHKSSGHIRNFGVAIGYTMRYVYPYAGNEGAIGLHYPDHPEQWPMVKKITESGVPALAGPVNLVQGGRGLIYRVPLYIDNKYWGLLSTVIDLDSFTEVIASGVDQKQFEFAIRGRDGAGADGDMVLGDASLFDRAEAFTQEIDIPGGKWLIAVRSLRDTGFNQTDLLIRLLSIALASIAGWMMYMLIRSRSDLAALAMYDQLTGLPNRHLLEDRADMVFARHKRKPGQTCAILFLDLDGFKSINDRYGHKAGDAVLLAVAQRAKDVVRANDTIARWGGDEFIVLMDEVEPETLQPLVDRLRSEIESPIMFEDQSLSVGVSVGVAMCPAVGGTLDEVLKMADRQMYEEKVKRKAA